MAKYTKKGRKLLSAKNRNFLLRLREHIKDPSVIYVLKESRKDYWIEQGHEDGFEILDQSGNFVAKDMGAFFQYLLTQKETLFEEGTEITSTCDNTGSVISIKFQIGEWKKGFYSLPALISWLTENGFCYQIKRFRKVNFYYPSFFLTLAEASFYKEDKKLSEASIVEVPNFYNFCLCRVVK